MTNKHVARVLKHTASLIELTGGNAFRARAYASAARAVDGLPEPVERVVAEGRLTETPGVGGSIADDVASLLDSGSFEALDELYQSIPPGLLDVLRIKGLGPKKVRTLWQELGVTSLDDLEEMALTERIASLSGFGKKTQEKLVTEVHRLRTYLRQRHYYVALNAAEPVLEALRAAEGVNRAEAAGALRRRCEVVDRIELVATGSPEAFRAALADLVAPDADPADGAAFSGTLPDGFPLLVYSASPDTFERVWWQRTGSADHVAAFVEAHGEPEDASSEVEFYQRAGLAYVEPELREGLDELTAAAAGPLPTLLTTGDLRGTIHNHSTYSDGAHTLREMAEAARAMGYGYFGICDHSRSLKIAHGLSIEELRQQGEEVRQLNEEFAREAGPAFRIFHGSECDILQDGSMDYPDEVLAELDLVVASVHIQFEMTETEATERLITAVSNPYVHVLGHPTGRLLLRREGYPVDHDAVIDACAEHGVAIELNANPYRLDMDWRHIRRAVERGVLIAVNPDAHSVDGLADVQWGVAVARKGGLTAPQCLNAKTADDFAAWLTARRETAGVA